jgi:hypothetical protein
MRCAFRTFRTNQVLISSSAESKANEHTPRAGCFVFLSSALFGTSAQVSSQPPESFLGAPSPVAQRGFEYRVLLPESSCWLLLCFRSPSSCGMIRRLRLLLRCSYCIGRCLPLLYMLSCRRSPALWIRLSANDRPLSTTVDVGYFVYAITHSRQMRPMRRWRPQVHP